MPDRPSKHANAMLRASGSECLGPISYGRLGIGVLIFREIFRDIAGYFGSVIGDKVRSDKPKRPGAAYLGFTDGDAILVQKRVRVV